MKKLIALCLTILLCGCATMGSVQPLPAGSNTAIISMLDNRITYDYIGTTLFNNRHFYVEAPNNSPRDFIINSIKTELIKNDNHPIVISINENQMLTNFYAGSGTLTEAQKAYLKQITAGKDIQRIIIVSKATPFIDNMSTENAIGYGYIQKAFLGFHRTLFFGAITIAVIDTNDMKIHSLRNAYLHEKSANTNWVNNPNEINTSSIDVMNLWIQHKFIPNIKNTLTRMGM